jgi:hypothetical protein
MIIFASSFQLLSDFERSLRFGKNIGLVRWDSQELFLYGVLLVSVVSTHSVNPEANPIVWWLVTITIVTGIFKPKSSRKNGINNFNPDQHSK